MQRKLMDGKNNNPLLCDPISGICEMPGTEPSIDGSLKTATGKKLRMLYFTDPICSSCWGIEAQLKKLKLEYGHGLDIEYRMGGLLPNWSYNSGGISKPSDVAPHWDEVSPHYQMPIDGDVWISDPLDSSYPPSIAFKAAELQDMDKARRFFRIMREMVFLRKINIAKWENITAAAELAGLDTDLMKIDFNGAAKVLFEEDLKLAANMSVRGFPTIFIFKGNENTEKIYGFKPYGDYETAINRIAPEITKKDYDKNWEALFGTFRSLTLKEFSELSDISLPEAKVQLDTLVNEGKLSVFDTKNGSIWWINHR
ncbi:DsbA family protein [Pedobacter sp. UBA5917]|jgi:predicted DsbA family dithiol-disulfide isomerase|uniref:DsbA family protein n=1 Tax=Pedobacter sp. UBA5917 TaxID=1947061 RepID=UPI0025CBF9F1|nr:DsbA family protein [Pedobacter sp. UBA5917]